jgi:hypothetical protein
VDSLANNKTLFLSRKVVCFQKKGSLDNPELLTGLFRNGRIWPHFNELVYEFDKIKSELQQLEVQIYLKRQEK